MIGIAVYRFKDALFLINEHPGWDDGEIADQVDWRM